MVAVRICFPLFVASFHEVAALPSADVIVSTNPPGKPVELNSRRTPPSGSPF
jgi:hypothetical protein